MTDKLPPGVYNAVIQGMTPTRGNAKMGLRLKLALANAILTGTVMYEISLHDDMVDMCTHGWPYKAPPVLRSLRIRHYKAKPQPNCGPRSNNPW